jgi:hypothetical protein
VAGKGLNHCVPAISREVERWLAGFRASSLFLRSLARAMWIQFIAAAVTGKTAPVDALGKLH